MPRKASVPYEPDPAVWIEPFDLQAAVAELEKAAIIRMLEATHGNLTQTAAKLRLTSRPVLRTLLRRHHIDPTNYRLGHKAEDILPCNRQFIQQMVKDQHDARSKKSS